MAQHAEDYPVFAVFIRWEDRDNWELDEMTERYDEARAKYEKRRSAIGTTASFRYGELAACKLVLVLKET